jgi:hypothetical protein
MTWLAKSFNLQIKGDENMKNAGLFLLGALLGVIVKKALD